MKIFLFQLSLFKNELQLTTSAGRLNNSLKINNYQNCHDKREANESYKNRTKLDEEQQQKFHNEKS